MIIGWGAFALDMWRHIGDGGFIFAEMPGIGDIWGPGWRYFGLNEWWRDVHYCWERTGPQLGSCFGDEVRESGAVPSVLLFPEHAAGLVKGARRTHWEYEESTIGWPLRIAGTLDWKSGSEAFRTTVVRWPQLAASLGMAGATGAMAGLASIGPWAIVVKWRSRRRTRRGACASCGYDRAGLGVEAVCPECGA